MHVMAARQRTFEHVSSDHLDAIRKASRRYRAAGDAIDRRLLEH